MEGLKTKFELLLKQGGLTCGQCKQRQVKYKVDPRCYSTKCENAEYMATLYDPWIELWGLIRSESVASTGLASWYLTQWGVTIVDAELLLELDGVYQTFKASRDKQELVQIKTPTKQQYGVRR